ncbi:peroxiredoxin [Aeropyrum camini]|uniref:thioredoxin-dependent peroxiredoxin n=1 Tax=Aeropyrum camini SY1 = JCM 12091 TaxID=1198449 RepID=U3TEE5_9CREN|nr:peroxiredoxin [Aeropyrum camini]BAN89689.1 thiol peroxidase [Aeropyrum camini SY1 = JCM 12091]
MLNVGDPAPDIEIQLIDGSALRLSQLRGKIVVLYFYPKAFTPGCTREAIGFNGIYQEFKKLGAEVIGVSTDPPDRNRRFAEKYGVRFRLASDVEGEACKSFGVLKVLGPIRFADRVTFVIDKEGRIAKIIRGLMNAEKHAVEALEEVKKLAQDSSGSETASYR